ncbi:MAG: hypothetical protein IPK80_20875 [Nannocystis sp.]|nr:hypothetical protein [Nannocystis sp.]
MIRAELAEIGEDDRLDGREQAGDLLRGDAVPSVRAGLGAVMALPEGDAGEVGVGGQQLVPVLAVEVPFLIDERRQRGLSAEGAALGAVNLSRPWSLSARCWR